MFKQITMYDNQVGLVFRDGNYQRLLTTGKHWLRWGESLRLYTRTADFTAPVELNILLQDERFQNEIELVELEDHELALHFVDGNFRQVLTAGRHAFWKSAIQNRFQRVNLRAAETAQELSKSLRQKAAVHRYMQVFNINSFQRAVLFADGKADRVLEPGIYYFWNDGTLRTVNLVDMRRQQMDVSGQEILTKDKAGLRINFHLQYRVVDITKALVDTKDFTTQLYQRVQLALRDYIGTLSLDELLARKEEVNTFVLEHIAEPAADLGVQVLSTGIRDIILPGEVKAIMNQVLVAEKQAQANTILRREETAATRSLLNTAKLMEDNAMLLRLKEMEYVEKIADKINNISLAGNGQLIEQLREIFVK